MYHEDELLEDKAKGLGAVVWLLVTLTVFSIGIVSAFLLF